jgi:hypothetical protein
VQPNHKFCVQISMNVMQALLFDKGGTFPYQFPLRSEPML